MAKRVRTTSSPGELVAVARVDHSILLIRGHRVLLDSHLAMLYGVPVGRLNEAVKRNLERFPSDFMFRLTRQESKSLLSQSAISKGRGGRRSTPYAFTEQGVAMLSSVLNSPRAIAVNIEIMRAFVRLRQLAATHEALREKLDELEKKLEQHDEQFALVFEAIRQLMEQDDGTELADPKRARIGYQTELAPPPASPPRQPAKRRPRKSPRPALRV